MWTRRVTLAVALWVVYTVNGREIGAGDTVPAILLPIEIARGDGPVLDRFEPVLRSLDPSARTDRFLPYYAAQWRGHLVSRYPIAPTLVSLPFTLPQIVYFDHTRPGWDVTLPGTPRFGRWIAKNAAAAALAAVVLFDVLRALGLGSVALPATIVAALGSPLWTIAAQSPWQHGVGAFALAAAILLLPAEPSPPAGGGARPGDPRCDAAPQPGVRASPRGMGARPPFARGRLALRRPGRDRWAGGRMQRHRVRPPRRRAGGARDHVPAAPGAA
jgi:hypothetical protein